MDLLREMMEGFKIETNIDIVFVIDLSLGMEPMLSLVRSTPWGEIIKKLCLSQGREIGTLRFKVMWYADSKQCSNDSCFGESKFYLMPHEEQDFFYFLNDLHVVGDAEKTSGLEALVRALDSDWNQDGDRLRHIIILFTDKEAYRERVTNTMNLEYIGGKWENKHQPEDALCTFFEKWSSDPQYRFKGNSKLSVPGRRLLLFAPGADPWINLECEAEYVIRHDVAIGQGGREISDEDIQSIFYFH